MADDLTLMAVHAHPDDESSSTGGVLAAYGDAGVRTVVVTCTNGEFGDAPGGVKPGQDGHDEQAVAQQPLARRPPGLHTPRLPHLQPPPPPPLRLPGGGAQRRPPRPSRPP